MSSGREGRRRRIVDRGTDRIALITGQIRTLPSDSESDQSHGSHSHTASCPPSISQSHDAASPQTQDKSSGSLPPSLDSVSEISEHFMTGDRGGPIMRECESSMESSKVSSFDLDGKGSPAQDPQLFVSQKGHYFEAISHFHKIVSPKAVKSEIVATESTRTLCALVVAILVVLASVGFPILGSSFFKSVVFFRPLYLLLLTNVTIVVARLLERQRGLARPEQQPTSSPSVGETGLADQLGSALELAFLLQDVTGAIFMDCSVYAVTVICGLSLAGKLDW
ncbi:uncharacterized protein LOC113779689 isoform X1 [Coffea eugenioides]|uniref:uncharacterized protein LOC113779689 isoform X1 n=1 Tax=Coffea eugenioides TaxID=49369 RepID=UPI000F60C817|nr:uncharacterized protein LOC113779689 isoform X1 [Coffea eugenioides]